jgi:hypothetical protein
VHTARPDQRIDPAGRLIDPDAQPGYRSCAGRKERGAPPYLPAKPLLCGLPEIMNSEILFPGKPRERGCHQANPVTLTAASPLQ